MSAFQVGALRRRVALEAPADSADDVGGATRAYAEFARVWAQVTALSGETRLVGDRQEQAITHRLLLRWRDDVNGQTRIRLGARVFHVRATRDPDAARRVLVVDCEEITP